MSLRSALTRGAASLLLLLASSALALLVLEGASRVLVPIAPGARFQDLGGQPIKPYAGEERMAPNIVFRQISPDYDVLATTGPLGFRSPEPPAAPEVLLLGDSFTFGQGLADSETFAAIWCAAANVVCANLGRPGTGTLRQLNVLEQELVRGWRPKEVKLFVLAMSSALLAGNDFLDTEIETRIAAARLSAGDMQPVQVEPPPSAEESLLGWVVERRAWILARSNLARVVYARLGSALRTALSPDASAEELAAGIAAMADQFARLRSLSQHYGFAYSIYVLHPVQDLIGGTWPDTVVAVRRAAGEARVVDTAPALLADPTRYYFPYDGHFNADGARAVAKLLIEDGAGDLRR